MYTSNFTTTVKDLRKQTPGKLIAENKEIVQSFKAQKRKLLSETLRNVKPMGIRRNLGVDELQAQSSIALILATTPSWLDAGDQDDDFHEMLDLMPKIRNAAREHSDDLTNVDIARSVGSFEGMLAVVLKQGKHLSVAAIQMVDLDMCMRRFEYIATTSYEKITSDHTAKTNFRSFCKQRLVLLLRAIPASYKIFRIQVHFWRS